MLPCPRGGNPPKYPGFVFRRRIPPGVKTEKRARGLKWGGHRATHGISSCAPRPSVSSLRVFVILGFAANLCFASRWGACDVIQRQYIMQYHAAVSKVELWRPTYLSWCAGGVLFISFLDLTRSCLDLWIFALTANTQLCCGWGHQSSSSEVIERTRWSFFSAMKPPHNKPLCAYPALPHRTAPHRTASPIESHLWRILSKTPPPWASSAPSRRPRRTPCQRFGRPAFKRGCGKEITSARGSPPSTAPAAAAAGRRESSTAFRGTAGPCRRTEGQASPAERRSWSGAGTSLCWALLALAQWRTWY